jgi:Metallopeptidase family M24
VTTQLSDLPRISRESLGVPGERERYKIKRDITIEKVNTQLLPIMRRYGIDMWIVMDREYNPDPFANEIGGRGGVRNAHIFYDNGETLEKIFIFSHGHREDLVSLLYDVQIHYGYRPEGLKPHLAEQVKKRNPKRIGLNMSRTMPMADGLTVEMKKYLDDAIGPELAAREVSAELLQRDFRATRLPVETELYRKLVGWTVAWEEEGFSRVGITSGVVTPDDLHWWWRERAKEIGLEICSFLPGVRVIRDGYHYPINDPDRPILPGDVLSIDAGLTIVDYHTDIKRMAYVLRPGETEAPASLQQAYRDAKRVTDKLCENMVVGRPGYEVWEMTTNWASEEGYEISYPMGSGVSPTTSAAEVGIYCHSVGTSVHDIGAWISEINPEGFGIRVEFPMAVDNWYSVELHISTPIPEWENRIVKCTIEETAVMKESGPEFIVPRQEELLLIPA